MRALQIVEENLSFSNYLVEKGLAYSIAMEDAEVTESLLQLHDLSAGLFFEHGSEKPDDFFWSFLKRDDLAVACLGARRISSTPQSFSSSLEILAAEHPELNVKISPGYDVVPTMLGYVGRLHIDKKERGDQGLLKKFSDQHLRAISLVWPDLKHVFWLVPAEKVSPQRVFQHRILSENRVSISSKGSKSSCRYTLMAT